MAELRQDLILGRWVILSSARGKRPSDFRSQIARSPSQPGPCAFCRHHEPETGEQTLAYARKNGEEGSPDWSVRVVGNKYPAVSMEGRQIDVRGEGPFDGCCMDGFGSHEVVIETPDHDAKLSALPLWNVKEVLEAYRDRVGHFKDDERFKYAQVFKNHGNSAGASMRHSHSQIIALPIIPHNVQHELDGAKSFYDRTAKCVLCEYVAYDFKDKKRLIDESLDFVAITPYAPRFPYETWIVPRKHSSNYEEISDSELYSLARMLLSMLKKIDHIFDNPSYNYTLQTAPIQGNGNLQYYHWYIRIVPHLVQLGGFELGAGCHINPIFPESAAETFRKTILPCLDG